MRDLKSRLRTTFQVKVGLAYQRFCDHRKHSAKVNSKFWRICKKCLRELSVKHCVSSINYFLQILETIYLHKIPAVITEALMV